MRPLRLLKSAGLLLMMAQSQVDSMELEEMSELKLYNTLARQKEVFEPIDPDNVRMVVCGPRFCSPKSGNRFSDQLQNRKSGGSPWLN